MHLFDENAALLESAVTLLEGLSPDGFATADPRCLGGSIGGHTRHCLEFYGCFLGGLGTGHIDYDARARSARIERELPHALEALRRTAARLRRTSWGHDTGKPLYVIENHDGGDTGWSLTSVGRELQFLLSHTIHHFALIAILLRLQGREVPESLGVAPSTLRHRATETTPVQCVP